MEIQEKGDTMAMFTPREICDNYVEASVAKAKLPVLRLLILGFAAGAFIAIGAVTSSTAAHSFDNPGVVRMLSGLFFPVGLCMVVILGTELFTGNSLMVTAVIQKKITWGGLLRNWVIVFFANFAGALAVAICMAFFGQLNIGGGELAVYTAKVAASKSLLPWQNAFILGVFCNVLVCVAVYLGNSSQDTAGKILGIFLPIMAFVLCGFEHCVANMYYIPAGIFANMNPEYAKMIAEAGINTSVLNWGTFITANLIPVTLGNVVGGGMLGTAIHLGHRVKPQKTVGKE